MATCAACGTTIVFGGVRQDGLRYCNTRCRRKGARPQLAAEIPDDIVEAFALEIHSGACPRCGGPGPVDAHQSFFVWSALFFAGVKNRVDVSCRRCARRRQAMDVLGCLVCGWWSFPAGLVLTPIQLGRNFACLFGGPDPAHPSLRLEQFVRDDLASGLASGQRPSKSRRATVVFPSGDL